MLRVLIADDHALLRSGLRRILAEALAPVEVGEAKDASDLLAKLPQAAWDLVLLDISMPGRGRLDVLRDLKEQCPRLPVLVLSMPRGAVRHPCAARWRERLHHQGEGPRGADRGGAPDHRR